MRRYILLSLLALCLFGQAQAQKLLENNSYYIRLGYNVGGTAPVGMPATIRSLSRYTLQPNLLIAHWCGCTQAVRRQQMGTDGGTTLGAKRHESGCPREKLSHGHAHRQ